MKIDLVIGGPEWDGWFFAPYGRARNWRLTDPAGTCYTPAEISELRNLELDIDHLQRKVAELTHQPRLSAADAAIIREAAALLHRIAPPPARREARASINPAGTRPAECRAYTTEHPPAREIMRLPGGITSPPAAGRAKSSGKTNVVNDGP